MDIKKNSEGSGGLYEGQDIGRENTAKIGRLETIANKAKNLEKYKS
jgi:hypothetical protein